MINPIGVIFFLFIMTFVTSLKFLASSTKVENSKINTANGNRHAIKILLGMKVEKINGTINGITTIKVLRMLALTQFENLRNLLKKLSSQTGPNASSVRKKEPKS